MITWHYITRAVYDAAQASEKTSDKLYYLSDTHEIYRGTENFTESVILYSTEPAVKAIGKLYINETTLEGRIWNGTVWKTVIQPVQAAIITGDTTKPVSSKAVEDYVGTEIAKVTGSDGLVSGVSYTAGTNTLTVTMADTSTEDIPLTNVAADLVYDKVTGLLQVKNASGTTIGTGINLDLERFVSEAAYDSETKKITLKFNDAGTPLEIDVGDLVDTYTAANSETVALTVTGNEFKAEAIVAATEGNMLQKTASGLFVAATDISGKVDKVASAVAGDIATLTSEGGIADSGKKIGGETLAAVPDAATLATEAAVEAIRATLAAAIDGKMAKVATGHEDEIVLASATGDSKLSGVKIGGATLAESADAGTVATEAAVKTYVGGYAVAKTSVVAAGNLGTIMTASDEKVASEKALVDSLTWKTTI